MKGVLGLVSLLVVLAVVSWTAARALKSGPLATQSSAPERPASSPRQPVQQVQDDLNRALQQGAARREEVER